MATENMAAEARVRRLSTRFLRLAIRAAGAGAAAAIVGFGLFLGLLQFDGVSTRLANFVISRVNPYPGTVLEVEHVSGSWIRSLRLEGVRLAARAPEPAPRPGAPLEEGGGVGTAEAARGGGPSALKQGPEAELAVVAVRYRLLPLLRRRLEIRDAEIEGLQARLTQRPDSVWDVLAPFVGGEEEPAAAQEEGGGFRVRIRTLRARNAGVLVTFAPGDSSAGAERLEVERLTLQLSGLEAGGGPASVFVDSLEARFLPPGKDLDRVTLRGSGSLADGRLQIAELTLGSSDSDVTGGGTLLLPEGARDEVQEIDFRLEARPLSFRDLSGFLRSLDPSVTTEATLEVRGRQSRVELALHAALSNGGVVDLEGAVTPSLDGPVEARVEGTLTQLRLESLLGEAGPGGTLDARIAADLSGPDLKSLEGPLEVTARGLTVGGRPLRPLAVRGRFDGGEGDFRIEGGLEGFGSLAAAVRGRPFDDPPVFEATGSYSQGGSAPTGRGAPTGDSGPLADAGLWGLESRFALRSEGVSPEDAVASLDVDIVSGTYRELSVGGGSLRLTWDSGAGTFRFQQPLEPGRVTGEGEVFWSGGGAGEDAAQLRYSVSSVEVRDVDLARLLGRRQTSRVNAELEAQGEGMDAGTLVLDGRLRVADSEFGGLRVSEAEVSTRLDSGELRLSLQGRLAALDSLASTTEAGGTVSAAVRGRPFDAVPLLVLDSLIFAELDASVLSGPPTSLSGRAEGRLENFDLARGSASAEVELASSRVRMAQVDSARIRFTLMGGALDANVEVTSPEGDLDLRVDGRPFDTPRFVRLQEGRVRRANLGPFLGRPDLASDLNLDVNLEASGLSTEDLQARGTVNVLTSTLNRGRVEEGTLSVEAAAGRASLRGELRTGEGYLDLRAVASLASRPTGIEARAAFQLPDLGDFMGREEEDLVVGGEASLAREAATPAPESDAPSASPPLAFNAQLRGSLNGAAVDTLELRGLLGSGELSLDTLVLRSQLVVAEGGGRLVLGGELEERVGERSSSSDIGVTVRVLDLAPLGPLLGLDGLVASDGDITVRLTGPASGSSLEVRADLGRFQVAGVAAQELSAVAHAQLDSALAPLDARAVVDARAVQTSRVRVDTLRAEGTYRVGAVGLAARLRTRGQRTIEVALEADPRLEARRGTLERLDITTPDTRWALESVVPFSWKDAYRVEGLSLTSEQGHFHLDGVIDRRGQQDLTVRLEQASLSGLAEVLRLKEVGMLANVQLRLTGPATSPLADGSLRVELDVSPEERASIEGDFSLSGGLLSLGVRAVDPLGNPLTVSGTVPASFRLASDGGPSPVEAHDSLAPSATGSDSVDLSIRSDSFDLSWLHVLVPPDKLAALEGTLMTDARARGSLEHPRLEGRVVLKGGLLRLPALGTTYRDMELTAELGEEALRITEARIVSGDGHAELRGAVRFLRLTPEELDLSLRAERFLAVNTSLIKASLTGDLSVRGSVRRPFVTGDLELPGSEVNLDQVGAGADVRAVQLTPEDVRMLEDYFGYRVDEAEAEPSAVVEAFGLDLRLNFERDVWVRRSREPRLALEASGSLELKKEPEGDLQILGTVETLPERSYFRQFGRRFAVREGRVTFNGNPSDYTVRVDAQWEVPSHSNPDEAEVTINLTVAGDAQRLDLILSSDPEMDETDIISYLATGKPLGNVEAEGTAAGLGSSMAAGAVASAIEGLAAEAVELDVVEVQVDPVRGTTLIAGRYVSPDLYLGFRQPVTFSQDSKRSRVQNQDTEVEVEYRWFRWLVMNLQGGASEGRGFLRARHAY